MQRGAPPVHFSRKDVVGAALRRCSATRGVRVRGQLGEDSLEARRNVALAEAIAERALLNIAMNARRRD
jgi:DNA polymerase-3 subunit delta